MKHRTKVLVVDDDPAMAEILDMRLTAWGYHTSIASDGERACALVDRIEPDIVIADVVMPEVSGMELLRHLKSRNAACPVILITAQGTVDLAVDAIKNGAQEFLTKPIDYTKLKATLETATHDGELREQSERPPSRFDESGFTFGGIIGQSPKMRDVFELIEQISTGSTPVIITGESGTGKELVARCIHQMSTRSGGPFVAINAAAIPEALMESEVFGHQKGSFTGAVSDGEGCLELADGGTLFLDEIAEMPIAVQPKLLRVLEDGRVRRLGGKRERAFDVRLISATNIDPQVAIREGKLREDLYYRLNVFTILLPPLRNRREDIGLLIQYFIRTFNEKHGTEVQGVRHEPLRMLNGYAWPGNVRELRNIIERAVILAKRQWIEASHLPPYIRIRNHTSNNHITLPLGVTLADAEKELILQTLKQTGNNKTAAARQLNVDVKTIRNKLSAISA